MPAILDATSQICLGLGQYQPTGCHNTTDFDTNVPNNLRTSEIITCGHFFMWHEMTLWTLIKTVWSYSLTPAYVFMLRSLITRTDNFLCRNELSVLKTSLKGFKITCIRCFSRKTVLSSAVITARFFYRWTGHSSCCEMSRWMQVVYAIKLSCSETWQKKTLP